MKIEELFNYFRKMLSEIKNEKQIKLSKEFAPKHMPKIENPKINYIYLTLEKIPCCILQKVKRGIILGNEFADVEISEDEFNVLAEEALNRLEEVKKMQIAIMEKFVENF